MMPGKMFQLIGAEALAKKLARVGAGLSNRKPAHAKIVAVLDGMIQRNFRTKGRGFEETGWKPLAASTVKKRMARNKSGNMRILQDNGQLKTRWKHYYDNEKAQIQSGVAYGIYHDSDKPRKSKLPQRKILPRKEHYGDKVKAIYQAFVKGALSG